MLEEWRAAAADELLDVSRRVELALFYDGKLDLVALYG
jgi:hypothetical protein